ncbi:class II glutamine amidotransferase [uncultured Bifidobacterium sp.]|uniref:class II glutamine amidotransferase n=1 Tax=uncultured Bifidobacterium sp. TaxID=165187 RepID=UPI0028DB25ED|nr:class II glutamine amidotransferase [uncultured Bifidobacterium sp.]
MCRLLGYATDGRNLSLREVLGSPAADAYRGMAEIHNDGWGVSMLARPRRSPYRRDGGEASPETEDRLYRSTDAAVDDPVFAGLADVPARSALWHLRLASSHLPLVLENQQPFAANGLSFTHNGDISDDENRNIVTNRDFPVDRSVLLSTGGKSDSAVFFAVVLEYVGFGFALDEAVAQAVRELRRTYPKSSYNCMLLSGEELIMLRASARHDSPERIVELYDSYGRADQVRDYRVVRYRPIVVDEAQAGVVVASSGFPQPEEEGWRELENDHMLVASNRTGRFHVRAL